MRRLFAVLLVAFTASANELSYRSLQSGSAAGGTPLYDHGIHGEGQVVAVLDTGADLTSCYLADAIPPAINTRVSQTAVDPSRRKVIAYDFLYSCDEYPGARGCDDPTAAGAYDNQGHGTHAATSIAGDRGALLVHDYADAIAPGAKLVIQDAGFIGGDNCSQRPGIGCPVHLTQILTQAYLQGARIHSNSWGDRQNTPAPFPSPTANYSASARDVDAFVWSHPDFLVVFNTGNWSGSGLAPASSLSAPGCAKNTLQIGGTRELSRYDDGVLSSFALIGPARDGRIKPDLVGPAVVFAGDIEWNGNPNDCDTSVQTGTSWASPTIAGAAALVRQYYTDGFYPTGAKSPFGFTPSAALLKATLIAAARAVPTRGLITPSQPVPSGEQGWGFPVLDDALYFPGDLLKLKVADVPLANGVAAGETQTLHVDANAGAPFKVVLVWTDPPGTPRATTDTTPELVNDLDLRVTRPDGTTLGGADHLNNVEVVSIAAPVAGSYTISVNASRLGVGPRQSYALVVTGDLASNVSTLRRAVRH